MVDPESSNEDRKRKIFSFFFKIASLVRACISTILSMRRQSSGAILILLIGFLPLIILGIKYSEQLFKVKDYSVKKVNADGYYKNCAREAALAVAENWNSGLTLVQQKDGVIKVADAVYNAHPCARYSAAGQAIPGMEVSDLSVTTLDPSLKTVLYESYPKYVFKWYAHNDITNYATWNYHYIIWLASDKASDPSKRVSIFDEVDKTELAENRYKLIHDSVYKDMYPADNTVNLNYPTDEYFTSAYTPIILYSASSIMPSTPCSNYDLTNNLVPTYTSTEFFCSYTSLEKSVYSRRDVSSGAAVSVAIEDDKIKVRTDNQIGYAVPAKCNADIVLAIPVNGAANNVENRDAASDIAGAPYGGEFSSDAATTPIYQMGQVCKGFVKQFYHIRGVNMGLIPYSAKLSISPDKAVKYTMAIPPFSDTSVNTQKIIGAALYSTSGEKNAPLRQTVKTKALITGDPLPTSDTVYYWGGILTGCPIMCRTGAQTTEADYGNNCVAGGLLNDVTDPENGAEYAYRRMNLNPCYMGYANMLSMTCEKQCAHYLPNPYYMIELTADLVKIYEMCDKLYPIYDLQNVSNFVFIPVEWANNFFQPWTNDPSISASSNTAAESEQTLSRESKTAAGRKKILILLVNKPDWFEPGELTYLGFDNDASEIPMVESDKIDFSLDYEDSNQRFLDNTPFDGTIQGPKKILKIKKVNGDDLVREDDCHIANGTYRLTFPHKGRIIITVNSKDQEDAWECYNAGALVARPDAWWNEPTDWEDSLVIYGKGIFSILNSKGYAEYSKDGNKWYKTSKVGCQDPYAIAFSGEWFVILGTWNSIFPSTNGMQYGQVGIQGLPNGILFSDVMTWNEDEKYFYCATKDGDIFVSSDSQGKERWSKLAGASIKDIKESDEKLQLKWGGGYYVACQNKNKGAILRYSKDGVSWSDVIDIPLPCKALSYGPGYWIIMSADGKIMKSDGNDSEGLKKWSIIDGESGDSALYKLSGKSNWAGICYGNDIGKWMAYTSDGDTAVSRSSDISVKSFRNTSFLQNISIFSPSKLFAATAASDSGGVTINGGIEPRISSSSESIEIIIEPSQISDAKDGNEYYVEFTADSACLASAEITNREYEQVTLPERSQTRTMNYYPASYDSSLMGLDATLQAEAFLVYPKLYPGDISHIMEDCCERVAYVKLSFGEDYASYYMPGMTRLFVPMWRNNRPYFACDMGKEALKLYATDATMPYNYVLYKNNYQSENETPSNAVANVTSEACRKLKSDFGENARIYVIKYRAQRSYKTFPMRDTSQTIVGHDYTAVNECASSSNYLYKADSEDELKATLDTIAEDIKTFAGYEEAKNVEIDE